MAGAKNLLVETSNNIERVVEKTDSGQQMYIEGIYAQAEVINGNKRFYSREVMEGSIGRYIAEYVDRGRALGELNHPDYPMPDPSEAAVRICEMRMEGNDVYGKALVLNTPKGQTVRGLLEGGFRMGVSTRALGSLRERNDGIKEVQKDLMFTAVDCVDNPSAPDAYVNSIMESNRWMLSESKGVWVPVSDESRNEDDNQQLFLEKLEYFIKTAKIIRP